MSPRDTGAAARAETQLLRLDRVRAGYGPVTVLQDVSLEVNAGEVVTILGGNGAGKTTTLRAICGLIRPTAGRIAVEGRDTARLTPPQVVDLGVTMVPEGRQLFP